MGLLSTLLSRVALSGDEFKDQKIDVLGHVRQTSGALICSEM